jgi:hypothetical protein
VLAFLDALPAAAAGFDPARLTPLREAWAEVEHVNRAMGPTRLTGSPEHQRFVAWLRDELTRVLIPSGGQVFEDVFENFPRWSAKSWGLEVGGKPQPVASYFPCCTGGFTGARTPVAPAPSLAAPGSGGGYARADGHAVVAFDPNAHVAGPLVDCGVFTGPKTVDWSKAAGKIALVGFSTPAVSAIISDKSYTIEGTWADGKLDPADAYVSHPAPTSSILAPPDIDAANRAGVLGVVLIWQGISDGNAEGQYNPFPVPFSSSPASSPAGSDPAKTKPGIPALWVNETVGKRLMREAAAGAKAAIAFEATLDQVSTATVWGLLPGARYGQDDDEILICNTHSDGPNIAEENGGVAVVSMARYFSKLPRAERPKTMVFMASTGHFGHRFLGSGRDWIAQHPQILAKTVGVMTLEHLGCHEWQDVSVPGGEPGALRYEATGKPQQSQFFITAPGFQGRTPGPPDVTLQHILEGALAHSRDRAAILSGGAFFGEGGGFHALGIPTIGFIPAPQYLCAMAPDGEISKLDPAIFYDQLTLSARCLVAMQATPAAALKGAAG